MKLLLIGPRIDPGEKAVGGTVVSFELLISNLEKLQIKFDVINSNKNKNKLLIFFSYSCIIFELIKNIKKFTHVSFHGSTRGFIYLAPLIVFICKIFKKKISLRKFGGDFIGLYESSRLIKKILINYILKHSDIIFFQTKSMISYFSKISKNIVWLPTARNKKFNNIKSKKYSRKVVFISQIMKSKGIDEVLKVSNLLDSNYNINIYGPIVENEYSEQIYKKYNVNYKGVINPDEVVNVLRDNDILIFPTYYKGEGYPGIIIEAYSAGIPVVTTKWMSIPEIVEDYKSGILIEPEDVDELKKAIEYFNINNYQTFSQNAFNAFKKFDSKNQVTSFIEEIKSYST